MFFCFDYNPKNTLHQQVDSVGLKVLDRRKGTQKEKTHRSNSKPSYPTMYLLFNSRASPYKMSSRTGVK